MANETDNLDLRALSAALAAPPFATRGGGGALHAADRHVERWAPESTAQSSRAMRALGFVDRLVAPWIETAQRSASLRLFSTYNMSGAATREGNAVSWVFPRPWYQDELDWMAAARQQAAQQQQAAASGADASRPTMFTTRGTFVAPPQPRPVAPAALPAALYEYVAPSLSIAQAPSTQQQIAGTGFGGGADAYSPLVPLAAVQAAELMSRAVAPLVAAARSGDGVTQTVGRATPALRTVLTQMLARASVAPVQARVAQHAPELVTPPAPRQVDVALRASADSSGEAFAPASSAAIAELGQATQLAQQYAEQRAKIVELQRIARFTSEREHTARVEEQRVQQIAAQQSAAQQSAAAQTPSTQASAAPAQAQAQAPSSAPSAVVEQQRAAIAAAEVERTRIEERIAQRLAERQAQAPTTAPAGARMHDAARAAAAEDARSAIAEAPAALATTAVAEPVVPTAPTAPPEVLAAIAALPPALQQYIADRPGRSMAAINELADALRTAELMARSTASNTPFEATRGPRLMMPAGLGGLVAAVERAQVVAQGAGTQDTTAQGGQPAARSESRMPRLSFLSPELPSMIGGFAPAVPTTATTAPIATPPAFAGAQAFVAPRMVPTSALAATAAATPTALTHVAWADRWLARFAGATPRSLDILEAGAGATTASRMQALVSAAPESVFVRPQFDTARPASPVTVPQFDGAAPAAQIAGAPVRATQVAPAADIRPMPVLRPTPPLVERFDDNAETPDDVFAQIAAAAAGARASRPAAASPTAAASSASGPAASPLAAIAPGLRPSPADLVAQGAPSAPGAGLAAQLAASPFATALRHVLSLPAAPSFDVRALFGGGLSATFLAGLLESGITGAASAPVQVPGGMLPAWAAFVGGLAGASPVIGPELAGRAVPELDLTFVAPDAARSTEARDAGESPAARVARGETAAAVEAPAAQYAAPLTTMRSALLSWTVDPTQPISAVQAQLAAQSASMTAGPTAAFATPTTAGAAMAASPARAAGHAMSQSMSQSMSLPMLGGATEALPSIGAPGMVAERAHGWSVAQERSVSDLALDFVPPELVLAARVYGLGPAEAAQAMRLAIAGPGQLAAMAGTVDRTFVQAMAIANERRSESAASRVASRAESLAAGAPATPYVAAQRAITTAYPMSPTGAAQPGAVDAEIAAVLAGPSSGPSAGAPVLPTTAFGVERRAPRGSFLWPSATVAALGLNAATPDGAQSMPVAALELLAAQAVAEIGTYAAFAEHPLFASAVTEATGAQAGELGATPGSPATGSSAGGRTVVRGGATGQPQGEPAEIDVLEAASQLVAPARKARFDALYVALAQSPSGKHYSPAARAARALALAGRGEDRPVTAYERAATAWDVLPIVFATDNMSITEIDAATQTGALPGSLASLTRARQTARNQGAPAMRMVERPGLAGLTARAGEALGSYVAPSTGELASASMRSEAQAELPVTRRAPTAAQEMVQTGRPSRFGGGDVEIPSWFEAAARRMLDDRSGSTTGDGGFSLSELTLVTAAPSTHIAASTRAPASAASKVPDHAGAGKDSGKGGDKDMDIEKIANDVYRAIVVMMDAARGRNGEPYL